MRIVGFALLLFASPWVLLLIMSCGQPKAPATSAPPATSPQPSITVIPPTSTSAPAPLPEATPTSIPVVIPFPTASPTSISLSTPTATPETLEEAVEEGEQQAESCIPSGDHNSIQRALTGPGAKAVLCQKAVFELRDTISFTDENQWLYTQGFPTDDARALLRIVDRGVATAVSTGNRSGVKLSHVIIDGNRPELGIAEGGLIEWGGNGTGHVVEWVKAYEPRGWSVLVIGHGDDLVCSGSIARNNELGPAGRAEYIIADGISLACRNSIVENNTIIDATDGGIVIFQAPGSLVANNTIRAETRITFYGISMVDTGPYDGDFSGTRVTGNVIDARGALIRHGIDMGPYVGCIPPKEMTSRSFGAVVADNVLMGNHMGYGFVVSGVRDWTVTGNVDLSTHLGPEGGMDCFGQPVDPPGGFQFNPSTSNGTFQEEFEEAVFGFASSLWPLQTVVSEECVEDLLGAEVLEEIKAGERGPLWFALETAPKGEFIGRCISEYQPPEIGDLPGEVQVGVQACEPLCAEVVLFNISETDTADMRKAEFLLESLPVQCVGLLEFLGPGVQVRCIIEDYVTPGFQVLNWYGFPFIGDQSGWGFHYPFQE